MSQKNRRKRGKGFVSIVGAGPGDPKLLTLKAKEALERADVVVYDYLVHPSILKHAPRAQHIYVGKKGGDPDSTPQKSIELLIAKLARAGKRIVRLKGGDPFIFGRGGEEALWLAYHRVPFEIVPGVTAGIAAPAYAGIPVTHRGLASEVTFVTAHEDPRKKPSVNWKALAQLQGTLVLYMGIKTLPQTVQLMIRHGRKSTTPVSVIRWGTTGEQKTVTGTLRTIVEKVEKAKLTAPALTVIGEVNRLRTKIQWFEQKPLFGKTVLVTRSRRQASQLTEALEAEGARVIELPTIEISPIRDFRRLDEAIRRIAPPHPVRGNARLSLREKDRVRGYDWLVFTSENGVEAFFDRFRHLKYDARTLSHLKIAAIGPGTKAKLNAYSVEPDLMPRVFTTEGLLSAFRKIRISKKNFLLLRTNIAPDLLKVSLVKWGAHVTEIPVYRTEKPEGLQRKAAEIIQQYPIDYMTFTSSSTVKHFFEALRNGRHLGAKVISIGPVTSKAIQDFGVIVDREARVQTISGLVHAVLEEAAKS
ncbi:MAG: uroporphyrinogen-III C-methyltransferase [Candidatus Omnitrophica bacterium]|nr:uroporphyrinogen-III C-methyltransferase [Candidatus Omnitrophota bacterium]